MIGAVDREVDMKALFPLLFLAGALPATAMSAQHPTVHSPLLGKWAVDVSRLLVPPAARPDEGMTMRMIMMLTGTALLAGCVHDVVSTGPEAPTKLADTQWTIVEINGAAPTAERKAEILFTADRISGNAGCNSFGGGYTLAGSVMTASQIISTKMACLGPGMDQENAAFKILGQPMTVTRQDDGSLTLSDEAGTMILTPGG